MVNSLKSNAQAIHETHSAQCNSKQFNATHTNYVTNISQQGKHSARKPPKLIILQYVKQASKLQYAQTE